MPKNMNICGTSVWDKFEKSDISGYLRTGKDAGPILHLLHGNGFSSGSLFAMAEFMPSAWTLMASDLPGHGLTPVRNMKWPDWNQMADTLAQNVVSAASEPVVGIGHSMGGVITLLMAAKYPRLFRQIILLDPVLFPSHILVGQRVVQKTGLWGKLPLVQKAKRRQSQWGSVDQMYASLKQKSLYKEWHPIALKSFCETGSVDHDGGAKLACNPNWEANIFGSAPSGLWGAVQSLRVPTHILVADHGFDFIPGSVKRARRINPHISSQLFGGSHCFPMERPEKTAQAIMAVLNV